MSIPEISAGAPRVRLAMGGCFLFDVDVELRFGGEWVSGTFSLGLKFHPADGEVSAWRLDVSRLLRDAAAGLGASDGVHLAACQAISAALSPDHRDARRG